jgi:hypothetical protein
MILDINFRLYNIILSPTVYQLIYAYNSNQLIFYPFFKYYYIIFLYPYIYIYVYYI